MVTDIMKNCGTLFNNSLTFTSFFYFFIDAKEYTECLKKFISFEMNSVSEKLISFYYLIT